jgi:hypothetical protein
VFIIIIYGNKNILKKMFNKYNMKKISLLLAIPIVLAASLVFGSLSFSVYGQESQTITPLGNQTTSPPQTAPATTDNSTSPQTTSPPQTAPATTDNSTSPQNNQTSSQSSGGNLKLENILQWSNGAVQANEAGNGTGVSENLLKLQEYLKSSSGDKVISLPANQIGSG